MNRAIIMGRMVKDIEIKTTSSGRSFGRFTVAVPRNFKDANGNNQADFINCVAWGQSAGFVAKYFPKGNKILLEGSIMTSSYKDKSGITKNITEINVLSVDFVESRPKTDTSARPETKGKPIAPDMNASDDSDFELPF